MDIVGPFVTVIDTYLISPISRRIKYLRSSQDNVNDLQTVVQDLKAKRNDEQSKLKAEENDGGVETEVANNWFKAIHEIEIEADVIEKKYNQSGTCAGGWCVNCWSRYKLSKRSATLKLVADHRLNEQFDRTRSPSPKPVIEMSTEPIIAKQPSTRRILQQMLDCIGDPDPRFGIIGAYGMGGVGKTTLAKEVNNHFENDSCFETVIMVTVCATPNIRSIQINIGKRLGFDKSNDKDSEADAREKLLNALRKKKFLLILDDVWRKLNLEVVGNTRFATSAYDRIRIPDPLNNRGSKILVTSRNQDTCTDMGASKTIKVRPLSEAESWELFVKVAGEHVTATDIKSFAEKIVGRCDGLPLAIVTVARAMANRHEVGSWKNASREMELSATEIRGMKEEVFIPLKFSFDKLENDMLRSLFLYCACFPEDYNINIRYEILDYCVGEGLVDRLGSLNAARDKGVDLIESLKIACMLEDGEYEDTVKMHDMMRELAIWVTSSEYSSSGIPKFLIRSGKSVKEAPQIHEWVDATRISLCDTQIEELPEWGEMCPKLNSFLFWANSYPTKEEKIRTVILPTNFLQHMDHLSVLDLSKTMGLEYLPDSLSCLVNLRVLRLQGCSSLKAMPALGMLRQLQLLDLSNCEMLDQQIFGVEFVEGVSNLRYLNVEWTKVSFPVGVISRLHKVEELSLFRADKIKWRVSGGGGGGDEKWDGSRSVVDCNRQSSRDEDEEEEKRSGPTSDDRIIDVRELSHLTNLTSLSISFQDIIISDDLWFKPLAKKMKRLRLWLFRCTIVKQDTLQALKQFQNLRFLRIEDCPGVTCVPTGVEVVGPVVIENCEDFEVHHHHHHQDSFKSLFLGSLPKLERICSVNLTPLNCFDQLSWITIEQCNSLKMIFTKGMPGVFNNLEEIRVLDCERMEVIIEADQEEVLGEELEGNSSNINGGGGGGGVMISPFPRLKRLELIDLPALHDVCNNHILQCPLIQDVMVSNCPRLKKDPLPIRNADGLLVIIERNQWWKKGDKVMEEEIQASL
ncbi:disease resistance protein RPS2-like [Telopea speciosissima]|uniref:disease resistance protein RPS2-like n=1 Tax=Telopea speciosissima TaxID=54955 RepID=UPI001CC59F01|nr:disease resistance protein RPS2-like [Telopea speciosissima]